MTMLSNGVRKAKKHHNCDGFYYIDNSISYIDETLKHSCKGINPKERYHFQNYVEDGELRSFKCCVPCADFAAAHDISMCDE